MKKIIAIIIVLLASSTVVRAHESPQLIERIAALEELLNTASQEQEKNRANSEALKKASKADAAWLDALAAEAEKEAANAPRRRLAGDQAEQDKANKEMAEWLKTQGVEVIKNEN